MASSLRAYPCPQCLGRAAAHLAPAAPPSGDTRRRQRRRRGAGARCCRRAGWAARAAPRGSGSYARAW
eukprot:scaffold24698_cov63-Phaeocystis_antarctica.AAC.6